MMKALQVHSVTQYRKDRYTSPRTSACKPPPASEHRPRLALILMPSYPHSHSHAYYTCNSHTLGRACTLYLSSHPLSCHHPAQPSPPFRDCSFSFFFLAAYRLSDPSTSSTSTFSGSFDQLILLVVTCLPCPLISTLQDCCMNMRISFKISKLCCKCINQIRSHGITCRDARARASV
jgi:hypothetical protein